MGTPTFVILIVCFATLAVADYFRTTKGKEYKNATVSRVEPDGIVIKFKGGIVKILFTELPKDVQLRFGYDTDKIEAEQAAARAAEEKRIEEQRAAEEKRIDQEKAAERGRAEREKGAEADLKQSVEKFQVAEQHASQIYQNAQKGTVSGQVFVSSKGGENFKLGAVQVELFARGAMDALLAVLKKYADVKIQELSPSVDAAKAASDQADAAGYFSEAADKARNEYQKIRDERDSYYSGSFYFSYLRSSIQVVETDADGKFIMNVPRQGSFVIAARAERYITQIDWKDITEHYYWLQPISLEGEQQRVQNLSNKNLTSTAGTSSLIQTQD